MADRVEMPSTMWTLIGKARGGDEEELDRLLRKYRPPVLAFVRNAVRDPEEAEDVVQEAFVILVQDEVLAKADRAKGKFRSLLLAVTRHVISARRRSASALRRGGGRRPLSLSSAPRESVDLLLENLVQAPSADDAFDTLWVENLVRLAMNRVREECLRDGTRHFEALFAHVNDGLEYAGIAEKLDVSVTDVKNYVHQARVRLRRYVLQEIRGYSSSGTECEAEVAYLMKFLE